MGKYLKTKMAVVVTCKCKSIVAASMIYGGIEIDGDFTMTMAEVIQDGGFVSIIDTQSDPIKLSMCDCKRSDK